MPRLSRRLLLLPLLLLVPLGVLKWRADWVQDHPPVSKADQRVRLVLSHSNKVEFYGYGFTQLVNLQENERLIVRDPATLRTIAETLRCRESASGEMGDCTHYLSLQVYPVGSRRKSSLDFWRATNGSAIQFNGTGGGFDGSGQYMLHSRFVPRWDALMLRLVAQAKTPGHHPEITIEPATP